MRCGRAASRGADRGGAARSALEVAHPRRRHHHHPSAAEVGAPAQIDVLAVEGDLVVEAAEAAEQVGTDQQAGRRAGRTRRGRRRAAPGRSRRARRSDRSRRSGRRRDRRAAARCGSSHSTSFGPTMPAFERYSSSTSSRMASGSRATSSWRKQKKPLSPSTSRRTSLAAGPKPGLPSTARTKARGSGGADPIGHDHRVRRPPGQASSGWRSPARPGRPGSRRSVTPVTRLVHHHHGHDGRCELAGGFHDHTRLAARPADEPVTLRRSRTLASTRRTRVLAIVSTLRYAVFIDATESSPADLDTPRTSAPSPGQHLRVPLDRLQQARPLEARSRARPTSSSRSLRPSSSPPGCRRRRATPPTSSSASACSTVQQAAGAPPRAGRARSATTDGAAARHQPGADRGARRPRSRLGSRKLDERLDALEAKLDSAVEAHGRARCPSRPVRSSARPTRSPRPPASRCAGSSAPPPDPTSLEPGASRNRRSAEPAADVDHHDRRSRWSPGTTARRRRAACSPSRPRSCRTA